MKTKVLRAIEKYGMLANGDNVIVALSGGADSMALFHFLATRREALGITLMAAHLEHGLRGQRALEDMAYVQRLCDDAGVELFTEHARMGEQKPPKGLGIEEWGRRLRYEFFARLGEAHGAKVALAHTLSDNAETVLFRAVRGTGPRGLGGIPPVRGRYVRPLIDVSRAEVEAYCAANGLHYIHDCTNDDLQYSRNRLRLQVMPLLEQAHPGAGQNLARLAGDMRSLDDWLHSLALALLREAAGLEGDEGASPIAREGLLQSAGHTGLAVAPLLAAPAPVRLRALALLAGPRVDRNALDTMETVLAGELAGADIPGGMTARHHRGRLYLYAGSGEDVDNSYEIELGEGAFQLPGGHRLTVRLQDATGNCVENQKSAPGGLLFTADCDKINNCSVFRCRRQGDTFAPAGRGVTKTLKKWMNEAGIPPHLRAGLPLLACGSTVLWVWGAGFAQGLQPDADTERLLLIETENTEGTHGQLEQ